MTGTSTSPVANSPSRTIVWKGGSPRPSLTSCDEVVLNSTMQAPSSLGPKIYITDPNPPPASPPRRPSFSS